MERPRLRRRGEPISLSVGQFEYTKTGITRFDWRDPYQFAVSISWSRFFLSLALIALVTHLTFATLYWLSPDSVANAKGFWDDFFFSIETLATVGYGVFAPVTRYAHIISGVEIYTGLTQTALVTGLIFVRFSRPKGKLLFADHPVITKVDGLPNLLLRLGNGGTSSLTDAHATLHVILLHVLPNEPVLREIHDLALLRSQMPLFPLIWLLRHPIDEKSPLFRTNAEELLNSDARFFVTCNAYDQGLGARIYGNKNYTARDVLYGKRYQDLIKIDEDGRANADYDRFHLTEADGE